VELKNNLLKKSENFTNEIMYCIILDFEMILDLGFELTPSENLT